MKQRKDHDAQCRDPSPSILHQQAVEGSQISVSTKVPWDK